MRQEFAAIFFYALYTVNDCGGRFTKKIPASEDGYFCGYSQLESFNASHNEITEFPDIFNANSAYVFQSVHHAKWTYSEKHDLRMIHPHIYLHKER